MNKAPTEWVQTLNDEVLATAIIDRLLYRCEVIKLAGTSYRLENRKTIFTSESTVNGKQLRKAASKTNKTQQSTGTSEPLTCLVKCINNFTEKYKDLLLRTIVF